MKSLKSQQLGNATSPEETDEETRIRKKERQRKGGMERKERRKGRRIKGGKAKRVTEGVKELKEKEQDTETERGEEEEKHMKRKEK